MRLLLFSHQESRRVEKRSASPRRRGPRSQWIPAFAGMTGVFHGFSRAEGPWRQTSGSTRSALPVYPGAPGPLFSCTFSLRSQCFGTGSIPGTYFTVLDTVIFLFCPSNASCSKQYLTLQFYSAILPPWAVSAGADLRVCRSVSMGLRPAKVHEKPATSVTTLRPIQTFCRWFFDPAILPAYHPEKTQTSEGARSDALPTLLAVIPAQAGIHLNRSLSFPYQPTW